MFAVIVCYALLATFLLLERALRRGAAATALDATPFDRGTTRAIGISFFACLLCVLLAPLLSWLGWGRFGGAATAWWGILAMTLGLSLRVWANQTLGAFYTRTLKAARGQPVVSGGPYRLLRHPGYAGVILMWLGAGVAVRNWFALGVIALVLAWAYRRRIHAEEEMLLMTIGAEYGDYRRRTWRIIPPIY
jgi:protein-S-isoprenylcysteine O-methyltransferase Ste14